MRKVSETPQKSSKSQSMTKVESKSINDSSMSFIKKVFLGFPEDIFDFGPADITTYVVLEIWKAKLVALLALATLVNITILILHVWTYMSWVQETNFTEIIEEPDVYYYNYY